MLVLPLDLEHVRLECDKHQTISWVSHCFQRSNCFKRSTWTPPAHQHLGKLKSEDLVNVTRQSTFLCSTANTEALQEILQFWYAEFVERVLDLPRHVLGENQELRPL